MKTHASFSDLLKRLAAWLKKHRRGMLNGLCHGAGAEELDAWQARLGIAVPASLHALLAWHNGQKEDCLAAFEQDWRLMSTGQIEQAPRELLEDKSSDWQAAWLPIFDDDSGDYLFLDTQTAGATVRAYWGQVVPTPVVAASLEAWFKDFVTAVEKGHYHEEAERGTFIRKR